MIFYLTFNDLPSGIFSSQVTDVVKFINVEGKVDVRLLAFISLRNFRVNRRRIKSELKEAIVIPMAPGIKRWKLNRYYLRILYYFFKPNIIVGRSVLATQLAFTTGCKNVFYDGRGAIAEEWREYGVVNNKALLAKIYDWEKECVLRSGFRLAVSSALLSYWQKSFSYKDTKHVVIPCTLNKVFENLEINSEVSEKARASLGYNNENVVFIYSGSLAGWQSFPLMLEFMDPILQSSANSRMLFLSEEDENIRQLQRLYPTKVARLSVKPNEVPNYLLAADFGLLIRESSITNSVASPVKFAEYIACGLKVIVSEQLGDYTDFVVKNNCGTIINRKFNIERSSLEEKNRIKELSGYFTKSKHINNYKTLFNY